MYKVRTVFRVLASAAETPDFGQVWLARYPGPDTVARIEAGANRDSSLTGAPLPATAQMES